MKLLVEEFKPRLIPPVRLLAPLSLGLHLNVVRLRSLDMLVLVPLSGPLYYFLRFIWYLSFLYCSLIIQTRSCRALDTVTLLEPRVREITFPVHQTR